MDSKASARAKHASSQRGRARHSTRKHPPQAPQQQQATSDHQQPREKKDLQLPSNWSRYEEEEEEEVSHFDIPPVKSKGANYKDLLAEKSMIQGPDLATGRKALMVTRGRDLWSQFMDMDNLWNVHEVSNDEDDFFTLDLDFLNKELAKLDMAQRLLLDPEYACLGEVIDQTPLVLLLLDSEQAYDRVELDFVKGTLARTGLL
ncbi:hypothetical protein GOP47_0027646 [Adiantum capillus-veneris]|nr:hypothetical protein GOP47_0027646 [Adiantum capillus-veneris]